MNQLPEKLRKKLTDREATNSLRGLGNTGKGLIDFSSNDYLGFSVSEEIFNRTSQILRGHKLERNGASGSRLLSGNNKLIEDTEAFIADFHKSETALIFNSGYDANIGFFSSVPQRGDIIFYDEFIHASIRDGISLSNAKAYKFKHNDVADLANLINKQTNLSLPQGDLPDGEVRVPDGQRGQAKVIYVVTESVFSMDGDVPDLQKLADFCSRNNCYLIVDEAHAIGVIGQGRGLVQELGIDDQVFARIITFGKALGCHGAAILGSQELIAYLVNFARSFIYTTALSPHSVATIFASYEQLVKEQTTEDNLMKRLNRNIAMLRFYIKMCNIDEDFIKSKSAIHSCIIPGNERAKKVSEKLKAQGFDIKAILSPTVPEGKERLRICLNSFNTETEIERAIKQLAAFIHNQ
ncbi:MAG: 8-amino-7-oxononanoate synthase [Flavobacteriaceae bacterium]|jgi:8-amino-7-oxononanoate synthase